MVAVSEAEAAFLMRSRTATLATIDPDGMPRLVPICFVLASGDAPIVYTPLDEKPKDVDDVHALARVRDILARPSVALLVHRWSENWAELGWIRVAGRATLVEPGDGVVEHAAAVAALRVKYPQYATHRLEERPLIRIEIIRATSWGELG